MRGVFLLAGLAFVLVQALPARADTTSTLYFHPDGSLSADPGVGSSGDASYRAGPAAQAFVLRAHAFVQARASGVLEGAIAATLYRNSEPLGSGRAAGTLLAAGRLVTIVLDNPEAAFAKGDVLSIRVQTSRGLLGDAQPVSLVLTEVIVPASVPPPAPAPTPAPTPAPVPAATPPPSIPTLLPPAGPPAPSPAPSASAPPASAAPASAPPSAAFSWLASARMPWESATGALVLVLVAVATLGAWSLARLGRI